MEPSQIIKEYTVTEKAASLSTDHNQYVFEVFPNANKSEIAKAVETVFSVKVENVNTLNRKGKRKRSRTQRGKMGKTRSFKRAIVSLKKGDKIELV